MFVFLWLDKNTSLLFFVHSMKKKETGSCILNMKETTEGERFVGRCLLWADHLTGCKQVKINLLKKSVQNLSSFYFVKNIFQSKWHMSRLDFIIIIVLRCTDFSPSGGAVALQPCLRPKSSAVGTDTWQVYGENTHT